MENIKETEEHILVEFTNDSGSKYEVGYPKAAGYTKENMEAELANANRDLRASATNEPTDTLLKWVVDGNSETKRPAIRMGIVGGYVSKISEKPYEYKLTFANTCGLKFVFQDETYDEYTCWTFRKCNHYIKYNSTRPDITSVRKER